MLKRDTGATEFEKPLRIDRAPLKQQPPVVRFVASADTKDSTQPQASRADLKSA